MNKLIFVSLMLSGLLGSSCKKSLDNDQEQIHYKDLALIQLSASDSYQISNQENDLWCEFLHEGKSIYDFKLGAGGAISELRWTGGSNQPLLAQSYAGEKTDRIIQSTWWIHSLTEPVGSGDQRWNVTQGGDFNGNFSPVYSVDIDIKSNYIDVYSRPQNQWNPLLDVVFKGDYKLLSRYELLEKGLLRIRRVMIAGQPALKGVNKSYGSSYIEAWTPFKGNDVFNALALSFNASGAPDWYYYNTIPKGQQGAIPYYPNISVTETNGYAVVYNKEKFGNNSSNPFVSFVFGTKEAEPSTNYKYVLNLMAWGGSSGDAGIAVLPGLNLSNMPAGAIIDQSFYLYVNGEFGANVVDYLTSLRSQLPSVKIYNPGTSLPLEVLTIVNKINTKTATGGTRTEQLASITKVL
jgi:hypothetical protein